MKIFANIQTKEGHEVKHLNRRKAIRERCLNCSAWIFSEVRQCPITDCALYPFRMGTGRQDARKRNRAIAPSGNIVYGAVVNSRWKLRSVHQAIVRFIISGMLSRSKSIGPC